MYQMLPYFPSSPPSPCRQIPLHVCHNFIIYSHVRTLTFELLLNMHLLI